MSYLFKPIDTPVGELKLVANERALVAVLWENDDPKRTRFLPQTEARNNSILLETERQLRSYFAGELRQFSLPLEFVGTEFQKQVWAALLTIPWGETRSYAQIALQIGNPTAVRAVGAANGRNPLSIIAPCHRVIGTSGKLTGFAGGLGVKAWLLKRENHRQWLADVLQPELF